MMATVENEWFEVTLSSGWSALDGQFGVYLHKGRGYIQGTIVAEAGASTGVGVISAECVIGGAVIIGYTDPIVSSDIWPLEWDILVATSVDGTSPGSVNFADLPPNADAIPLAIVINGSWDVDIDDDIPETFVSYGSVSFGKHAGRIHLSGAAVIYEDEIHSLAQLIADGIPQNYMPLPPAIPSAVEHRLMLPVDAALPEDRRVVALVEGGGRIQLSHAQYHTTAFLAVDADAFPPGAGDYGSFGSGASIGSEPKPVYSIVPGPTDITGADGLNLSCQCHLSSTFPASADPNDPFEVRPAFYLGMGSGTFYKVVLNLDMTHLWFTIWRSYFDGRTPVKLADTAGYPVTIGGTGLDVFMRAALVPAANAGGDAFSDVGVVVRAYSTPAFYEAVQDTDPDADEVLIAMPGGNGMAAIITDPPNLAHWTGLMYLNYTDEPLNSGITPWFPLSGTADVTDQGWHRGGGRGTAVLGDLSNGIVPLDGLRG